MHTKLRLATDSDLQTLADIYVQAYNPLHIGEQWDPTSAFKLIKYLFEDQPDLFFVAEDAEKVVGGIVATVRPWWDGNHLIEGEFFLLPTYQHKGLGIQLLKKLFTTAKAKYHVVCWDTYTHTVHKHPLAWYKSVGFKEISHWTMITGDVNEVLATIKD